MIKRLQHTLDITRHVLLQLTLPMLMGVGLTLATLGALGAAPVATGTVVSSTSTVLLTANGITVASDGVGTAYLSGGYGIADCYDVVDATLGNTATVKLQHSYNGVNWVDLLSFPAAFTDTTDFTQTALFGNDTRATVTALANSNPITVSVRCVLKNTK